MNGSDYLKFKREEKQLTVRGFAATCGVAPRMVSYYESGEKNISSMPVSKAIKYFGLLGIDIEEFFFEYFPFKREVDLAVSEWESGHPRQYDITILKKRYYERLLKIKERNSVSSADYDNLFTLYKRTFNDVLNQMNVITDQEYNEYILELNYQIRMALNKTSGLSENRISEILINAIYHTEYLISDVGKICDVSRHHLRGCIEGDYDFELIRTSLALKLCYLLGLSFHDVFGMFQFD